ncbi:MAG: hypothetical protein L6V93_08055 [Clostridiales bacterium]|nr:MAG: hypothetical protein L6V93_08055 [Clostridiales bacterium]
MSNEAVNFKIVPSVVRANEETTLKIYSYNARFGFFDDITYNIVFLRRWRKAMFRRTNL